MEYPKTTRQSVEEGLANQLALNASRLWAALRLSKKAVILTLNREYIHEIYADLWYIVVNDLTTYT